MAGTAKNGVASAVQGEQARVDLARELDNASDRLVVVFSQAADRVQAGESLTEDDLDALRSAVDEASELIEEDLKELVE